MARNRLGTRRALRQGVSAAFLPLVGPFSNLTPVPVSSLSNLTLNSGGNHFYTTSRTSPLKVKNLTLGGATGLFADPSLGGRYELFIWADTVTIPSGSAVGGTASGLIYPDGSQIAGYDYSSQGPPAWSGGDGGSGSSGGGGGAGCSVPSGDLGGGGSNSGGGGADGGSDGTGWGQGGAGGRGTGSSALTGSPWTPLVGGANGDGLNSIQPGVGAAGSGGTCGAEGAAGGGGAGGSYVAIVCRSFLGPPSSAGVYAIGGDGGFDSGDALITEASAGGGGTIEVFAIQYTGSFVPLNSGGTGSLGTPASSGPYRIYELNKAGTVILATHTNQLDTWNNL